MLKKKSFRFVRRHTKPNYKRHGVDVEKSQGQWRWPCCSVLAFNDDGGRKYLSLRRFVLLRPHDTATFTYILSQDLLGTRTVTALATRPPPATNFTSSHGLGVRETDITILTPEFACPSTSQHAHNIYHNTGELNWSKVECADENLPPPRYRHSACDLNGKLVVFGGYLDGKSRTNDVWQFDPENHTWSNISAASQGSLIFRSPDVSEINANYCLNIASQMPVLTYLARVDRTRLALLEIKCIFSVRVPTVNNLCFFGSIVLAPAISKLCFNYTHSILLASALNCHSPLFYRTDDHNACMYCLPYLRGLRRPRVRAA